MNEKEEKNEKIKNEINKIENEIKKKLMDCESEFLDEEILDELEKKKLELLNELKNNQ
jgi:hypothetical protein